MAWLNPKQVEGMAEQLKLQLDRKEIKPSEYNQKLNQLIADAGAGKFGEIQGGGGADSFVFAPLKSKLEGMRTFFQDDVAGEIAPEIDADAQRYREWAEAAQEREAWQAQFDPLGNEQQVYALGLQQEAAMGGAPSRAELLMQRGMDQSVNDQYALAASARGGGASQALAMRQAQMGAAGLQQDFATQQAGLRAQEMEAARNAYMQGATGLRDSDYNQTMAQAQLEMQQREMNDRAMMGMTGFETGTKGVKFDAANQDANRRNKITEVGMQTESNERIAAAGRPSGFEKGVGMVGGALDTASKFYPPTAGARAVGGGILPKPGAPGQGKAGSRPIQW